MSDYDKYVTPAVLVATAVTIGVAISRLGGTFTPPSPCDDLKAEIDRTERDIKTPDKDGFSMTVGLLELAQWPQFKNIPALQQRLERLRTQYRAECGEASSEAAKVKEETPAVSMAAILLPNDLQPTVATAGAEGVYGTSTLSPLEQTIGRSVEKVAMPLLVLGLLAFGAFKAVETGDTSTVQRAWAMAVR